MQPSASIADFGVHVRIQESYTQLPGLRVGCMGATRWPLWEVEDGEYLPQAELCHHGTGELPCCCGPGDPEGVVPSVLSHVQMQAPAEQMPAPCQRSLEFHCFKIFINVKM